MRPPIDRRKGTRARRLWSTCRRFCTFEKLWSSSWCVAPRCASPARLRVWKQFHMHVLQSLVKFLCLARLWAFIAFDFFRFEWQRQWWQKWILRFLAWFLLSSFFTIVASSLSLVVLSLAFLCFCLYLSREIIPYFDGSHYLSIILLKDFHLFKIAKLLIMFGNYFCFLFSFSCFQKKKKKTIFFCFQNEKHIFQKQNSRNLFGSCFWKSWILFSLVNIFFKNYIYCNSKTCLLQSI